MYAGEPFSIESHAIKMKTISNVSNKVRHIIFSRLFWGDDGLLIGRRSIVSTKMLVLNFSTSPET